MLVVESPFADYIDFNPFDSDYADKNVGRKAFTNSEIADAAKMPNPIISVKQREKIKRQLIKKGWLEWIADAFLFDLWLEKQKPGFDLMSQLKRLKYHSMEELKKFLELLTDYVNKMPTWKFNGWSSEEIMQRERQRHPGQKPKIVMGPNMRARGITSFEQLQQMAARGEDLPPMPTTAKVSRNDPYPSGSGKKYKHFCGK